MMTLERFEPSDEMKRPKLANEDRTPMLARENLPRGFAKDGQVIIEEKTSTLVIEPDWKLSVDEAGNVLLVRSGIGAGAKS